MSLAIACVSLALGLGALAGCVSQLISSRRRERYISGLRTIIREREEMLDFALQASYARGWNDHSNFGLPMNLARVKPPEERSN